MFNLKMTRKTYQSPRAMVAEVDLEEAFLNPTSLRFNVEVKELEHVNEEGEPLYFESFE